MQGLRLICVTLGLSFVSAGSETTVVGNASLVGRPFPLSPSVASTCTDLSFAPCAEEHRLLSAFAQEPRDDAWADKMETKLRDYIQQYPGFSIRTLECRTSLCMAEVVSAQGAFQHRAPAIGSDLFREVQSEFGLFGYERGKDGASMTVTQLAFSRRK
jgi:hypothetical protein